MNQLLQKYAIALILTFEYTLILYAYRGTLRDSSLLVQAGEQILNRNDPYVNSMFVNSPISAVFFFGINKIIPEIIFVPLIQIVNVLGIAFFLRQFFPNIENRIIGFIIILLPFTSPMRALLDDVQLTGLVAGVIALSFRMSKRETVFAKYFSVFLLLIAIELKFQFAIPIAILIIARFYKAKQIFFGLVVLCVSHVTLNLMVGFFLEKSWFAKIQVYNKNSLLPGYETSVWKFFSNAPISKSFLLTCSTILVIVLLFCILYFAKQTDRNLIPLIILVPLVANYLHYYDLVLICSMFLLIFFERKNYLYLIPVVISFPPTPLQIDRFIALLAIFFVFLGILILLNYQLSNFTNFSISVLVTGSLFAMFTQINQEISESFPIVIFLFSAILLISLRIRLLLNIH